MRRLALLLPLLSQPLVSGCGGAEGCLEKDLTIWCFHSEAERGPVPPSTDAGCTAPRFEEYPDATVLPCDESFVVAQDNAERWHYWDAVSGEHLATGYFEDVNLYCGSKEFWYGARICAPPAPETDGT